MESLPKRVWQHAFYTSPKSNLDWLRHKLNPPAPATPQAATPARPVAPRSAPAPDVSTDTELNQVIPDISNQPVYQHLIAERLGTPGTIILLGTPQETTNLSSVLTAKGWQTSCVEAESALPSLQTLDSTQILVCATKTPPQYWDALRALKVRYGGQVRGLTELVLPFTAIDFARSKLEYSKHRSFDSMVSFYLGEQFFGPLRELDARYPLRGRTVIEFGPMEGYQTAGLLHLGAKQVTAIEARAENFIKTLLAQVAFHWENVNLVLDDFHNADATRYGQFDLVFAHGVYYHSVTPFLFFENLISLGNTIFIGGYCATDDLPERPFTTLEYQGRTYRVKAHIEANDFSSGVNKLGYYFDGEDLMRFFQERNYDVTVVSDEKLNQWAGRYLRFLAIKRAADS